MALENKLGLTSSADLAREEERISKKKALELFENGMLDKLEAGKFSSLQAIHKYLFDEIYDFAGEIRTVNIAKGSFRFAPLMYLQAALQNIDKMPQSTFDEIVEKYVEMNIAHPFREGNGRSTRIWLDQIFKAELRKVVDWSKVDKEDYLLAMERSPIKDIEIKHMFFCDKPISPSQMNEDGYKKVQAFREKYKDRGIYFTYSSDEEFKKLFFAQLSMHFLSDKKVKEATDNNVSDLKLMGIDEHGKLLEEASVYPFKLNTQTSMHQFLDTIRSMYQEIAEMNVGKRTTVNNTFFAGFTSPVDIDDEERKFITEVAEQLELELPDDFFDLGNLGKDSISVSMYGGPKLKGSSEEITKYRKIKKLHETISNALDWAPVEKAFSDKRCLRLAVQNCGKAIDEDVEITFEIPQKTLLNLAEFPHFTNDEMGYLLNDCDMSILFGIDGTAEYIEYSESERNRTANYTPRPYGLPGYVPNYSDDFIDELNDVFCYSIYPDDNNYIVKLKVDYIKHNTTVAFPSILFIKDEIFEIPYKISSKNNPDVVVGVLKVNM